MSKKIMRTGYMSEIDQFLRDFDKNRTKIPQARQLEIDKHLKIFAKRDAVVQEKTSPIWKEF